MYLEVNIPMSLFGYPAEVNWVFPLRQADVGRRCWNTFRRRNRIHDLLQAGPAWVTFVTVKSVVSTSVQRGGAIPRYGLSVSSDSLPPQWEAIVAVPVQAQCVVGDSGIVYCRFLHGAVLTLRNWPQDRQKKRSITSWSSAHCYGPHAGLGDTPVTDEHH